LGGTGGGLSIWVGHQDRLFINTDERLVIALVWQDVLIELFVYFKNSRNGMGGKKDGSTRKMICVIVLWRVMENT
jgi:hypothetical protein